MLSSERGLPALQLQGILGGSYKTSWFLEHRIRAAMASGAPAIRPPVALAHETPPPRTDTSAVLEVIASARRSSGTSRTVTPRPAWARNGKTMLVNSPCTTTTSLPSGRPAATSPAKTLAWLPAATAEGSTPTSDA